MKATGIVRKTDELGRIVLPMELRNTLELKDNDRVEIFVDEDTIVLRKYKRGCNFCGSLDALTTVGDKALCRACLNKFAAAGRRATP
jgi:transcriptional pleiotropic regulator of transition state genes